MRCRFSLDLANLSGRTELRSWRSGRPSGMWVE
jgi:hypothetical protein